MEIPGPSRSYCAMLDDHLLAKEASTSNAYYPLRPSASGYCARKLAYDLAAFDGKIEKPADPKKASVVRLLNLGHSIEYHALNLFSQVKDLDVKFKQQVVSIFRLPSGRLIEGSIDAAFVTPDHKGIMDVKSVGDGWAQSFKTRWDGMLDKYSKVAHMFDENSFYVDDVEEFLEAIGEDALVANIVQLNLYLTSDFAKERGFDHGVIYRYNKNNSTHMEIRFKPSDNLKNWVHDRFNRIEEAVAAGTPEVVEKEFVLGSMACGFCPWSLHCWPEAGEAKKEYFKTLPKKKWAEDSSKIAELSESLQALESYQSSVSAIEKIKTDILKLMTGAEVYKVKSPSGKVYEAKFLQSPKPRYELRESKE